jgi:biopolymer transport protein ExbD
MRFRRRLSPTANVDLIPMIDVVFQLVVFFMVSSTFALTPGIAIDLPASQSSEPVVINRLVVTVGSDSEFYVNREQVSLPEMLGVLQALDGTDPPDDDATKSAIVEADATVSYETIVSVLDVLRQAGYRGIALRTLEE